LIRWRAIGHRQRRCKGRVRGGDYTCQWYRSMMWMLFIVMGSEVECVEWRQNRQKLGCVPFLCGKNLWRLGIKSHWQTGWGAWSDWPPGSAGDDKTWRVCVTIWTFPWSPCGCRRPGVHRRSTSSDWLKAGAAVVNRDTFTTKSDYPACRMYSLWLNSKLHAYIYYSSELRLQTLSEAPKQ